MVDKIRGFVTVAVVVIVGVYVMDKLTGADHRVPIRSGAGETYVNARGVIDAAKRIAKDGAANPANRLERKDSA